MVNSPTTVGAPSRSIEARGPELLFDGALIHGEDVGRDGGRQISGLEETQIRMCDR